MGISSDIGMLHILLLQNFSLLDDLQLIAFNELFVIFSKYVHYIEYQNNYDRQIVARKIFYSKSFTGIFDGEDDEMYLESSAKLLIYRQIKSVYLKFENIF